jgi:hypothetical protein
LAGSAAYALAAVEAWSARLDGPARSASAFYATIAIITGITANICLLFTANHTCMQDNQIYVSSDCVASSKLTEIGYSLRQTHTIPKPDIHNSRQLERGAMIIAARRVQKLNPSGVPA